MYRPGRCLPIQADERGGGVGAKYDEGAMSVVSLIFLLLRKSTLLPQKPIGEIGANQREKGLNRKYCKWLIGKMGSQENEMGGNVEAKP